MLNIWPYGAAETRGSAYAGGWNAIRTDFANEVLFGAGDDQYSAGISAGEYARRYPVLATASGIHNLQLMQMIVSGLEIECFCEGTLPDGTKMKLEESLPPILQSPLPWDESYTWNVITAQAVAADILCGEIFLFKHLDRRGKKVIGLEIIPNHEIRRMEEVRYNAAYEITVTDGGLSMPSGYYDASNVCAIVTRPVLGYTRGVGAQQMATAAVTSALMVDVFSAQYYENALSIGGVILTKGGTDEQIELLEEKLRSKFKGVKNAHRWFAMNADEMDMRAMSPTPANAQLIRASERAAIELGKITGVSPTQANESITGALSYAIAGAHDVQMGKNRVQPFARLLSGGVNRKNTPTPILPFGKKMGYMLDDLLRGDERTRNAMIGKLVKDSLISVNQGNRMMGLPTYAGDNYEEPIAPMNWAPVSKLGETAVADNEAPVMSDAEFESKIDALVQDIVDAAMAEADARRAERNGFVTHDEFETILAGV